MNTHLPLQARPLARAPVSASDALWVTYRWMTLGLAVTAAVAWVTANSDMMIAAVLHRPIVFYGLFFVQLALVFSFGAVASRASTAVVAAMFLAYAAVSGVTFSAIFLVYTASSIASTFLVTAGAFAGLSVFGLITKRDLSSVGRFAIFALVGLILATVLNFFLASTAITWLTTFAGVLIFGALTAYDTQRLKDMYAQGNASGNMALVGALTLYLDFINMFLFLLRIFGRRR